MEECPTLATPRLLLRPFTVADAPEVHRLAGERAIASTTLHIPHPYDEGMAERWIGTHQAQYARGEGVHFALVRHADHALLGAISLRIDPQHRHAELGYWLGKPYWHAGYATEAARAVVAYGFEGLGLQRIHASHMTRNPASGRVLQKIGMRSEGCLRQHVHKWGVFEDLALYGILRSEYGTHPPREGQR